MTLLKLTLALFAALAAAFSASNPAVSAPFVGNVTSCLESACPSQISACNADATCKAGITCIEACPPPATKACIQSCISGGIDVAMLEAAECAESSGCLKG